MLFVLRQTVIRNISTAVYTEKKNKAKLRNAYTMGK